MSSKTKAKEFRDFFEAIDEDLWCTDYYKKDERCCALGHLGCRDFGPTGNSVIFDMLAKKIQVSVLNVNDIPGYKNYNQETPKQRILALCEDLIKAGY